MAGSIREFILADGTATPAGMLPAVTGGATLDGALSWANDRPPGAWRRTWLDTFDWRLYRAGLTLELLAGRHRAELALTGRDGAVLAGQQLSSDALLSRPALVGVLPAGPLRELVEQAVGVRALLPVARATSTMTELRALNDDAKTVARLTVDRMAVTFPARGQLPPRLTLTPVRGYSGITARVGRALDALPGVAPGPGPVLDRALALAGLRPGELAGKAAAVELTPSMPAAAALAAILTALFDALAANVPGTVKDIDTEFLHDLRIAVRWTRSVLKLCGGALPGGLAREFRAEFSWLGDLTTPTRDLDVYLLDFPRMTAGLVGAAESDLAPFHDYLKRSRAAEHRRLAAGLRSARFRRLTANWHSALSDIRPHRKGGTAARLAAGRISTAQRRALRTGQAITPASPARSLHDLRKRCKELRYLVEMFGSLHDPAQRWQAVRELKSLQDCLGAFQDADVQHREIRAFAGQMLAERSAPAETLLAMGEIAAGLARRQQAARSEFGARFAAFAGPASQARITSLTTAARQ